MLAIPLDRCFQSYSLSLHYAPILRLVKVLLVWEWNISILSIYMCLFCIYRWLNCDIVLWFFFLSERQQIIHITFMMFCMWVGLTSIEPMNTHGLFLEDIQLPLIKTSIYLNAKSMLFLITVPKGFSCPRPSITKSNLIEFFEVQRYHHL